VCVVNVTTGGNVMTGGKVTAGGKVTTDGNVSIRHQHYIDKDLNCSSSGRRTANVSP